MTNVELADFLERHAEQLHDGYSYRLLLSVQQFEQVLAALRPANVKST